MRAYTVLEGVLLVLVFARTVHVHDCIQVHVGQTMKSDVVLIKDEFAVVMLIGNTRGRLAYVPTRVVSGLCTDMAQTYMCALSSAHA